MSETKRRNKGEAPREDDFQSGPQRQTRVTLTKDVSSKYRKIMPKEAGEGRGGPRKPRQHDDGSTPPMRNRRTEDRPKFGERPPRRTGEDRPKFGERPPRRTGEDRPKFGERPPRHSGEDRPKFGERPPRRFGEDRPKFGERPPRHSGEDRPKFGERPPRRYGEDRPKFGERPPRHSGEDRPKFGERPPRRFGEDRPKFGERPPRRPGEDRPRFGDRPRPGDRPGFSGRSAPHRKDDRALEMRAIVDRELPEAARQVREAQELILETANEMLGLTELLENVHGRLDQALNQAADEYQLLGEILNPAREHLDQARAAVVKLFEKMSFQDLAGQRLAKVEHFCSALTVVLGRSVGQAPTGRESGGPREKKPRWPKPGPEWGNTPPPEAQAEGSSRLKGPQAAGEGMDQDDIDRLLSDDEL